jgi:hypothetical protein
MDKATTQKFLEAWITYTGFSPGSVKDIRVEEDPMYKGTYAGRVDVGDPKPFDFMVTGCNPVTMTTDAIADLIEECEFVVFPPRVRGR